eukprot:scaffold45195_cov78-Cyclotella_meneghiniana.AAC.2
MGFQALPIYLISSYLIPLLSRASEQQKWPSQPSPHHATAITVPKHSTQRQRNFRHTLALKFRIIAANLGAEICTTNPPQLRRCSVSCFVIIATSSQLHHSSIAALALHPLQVIILHCQIVESSNRRTVEPSNHRNRHNHTCNYAISLWQQEEEAEDGPEDYCRDL